MDLFRRLYNRYVDSWLQGEIKVSYSKLVEVFGEPDKNDGYKTDAEWVIQFSDGVCATIYNYKDGRNYLGKSGKSVFEIVDWHIGGRVPEVVSRIQSLLV